jgi:hypothetical protein
MGIAFAPPQWAASGELASTAVNRCQLWLRFRYFDTRLWRPPRQPSSTAVNFGFDSQLRVQTGQAGALRGILGHLASICSFPSFGTAPPKAHG